MLQIRLIVCFVFIGCAGPGNQIFFIFPQKSYLEYLDEFKSCTGKGRIDSKGLLYGRLSFSYKSQRDSTFLQFTDILGRKALLMWITPNNVIARDLIENKRYGYKQIMEFFPLMKILEPSDFTEIIWGVEPQYKEKFNNVSSLLKKNIVLEFQRKHLGIEKRALVNVKYIDKSSNQMVSIDIGKRHRNTEYVNLKKYWKLLKY